MLPNWKERLSSLVSEAVLQSFEIEDFKKNNILPKEKIIASISRPRNSGNGDASSNIAFLLSKIFNSNPMEISSKILQFIEDSKVVTEKNLCKKIEIARPGFINFWFSDRTKFDVIREIFTNKEFGYNKKKCSGQKIIIEYVSANPTGPLHVGHARQAVLGDSIANILIAHGAEVFREFYYNDAGNQIDNLTNSVKARMNGITPSDPLFPVDGYQGDYIKEIAKDFIKGKISSIKKNKMDDEIKKFAVSYIRSEQKNDLAALGVSFDGYCLESSFYENGEIEKVIDKITKNKKTFEKDSALWFKSSIYGDDKDRVMRKSDGAYTYFVPDLAYHFQKWNRGFKKAINIQGFDHHGTIKRVSSGLQALDEGINKDFPKTILHKMVKVVKDHKEVKISKRSGSYVTLRDLICWAGNIENYNDYVNFPENPETNKKIRKGKDVVRFFLISKKAETEFTFDVDIAKKQNEENPVFYIQYAYARAYNLIKGSGSCNEDLLEFFYSLTSKDTDKIVSLLDSEKETRLFLRLAEFPTIIDNAVTELSPHVITFYLMDLAGDFHSYYNETKINVENEIQKNSRLLLVLAFSIVLKRCLSLLGISAPKKM